MKKLYTLILVSLLLPIMSFAKSSGSETVYSLFSKYNETAADRLVEPIKSWTVTDVRTEKGLLSFKIKGFSFTYKWVGKTQALYTLNGHAITLKQYKNKTLLHKRMLELLEKVPKKTSFSLIDLIFPQAHARSLDQYTLNVLKQQGLLNTQPSYSAFWSKLFGGPEAVRGKNIDQLKDDFAGFLGMSSQALFGDGIALLSAPWPAPLNVKSNKGIFNLDVGSVSVK